MPGRPLGAPASGADRVLAASSLFLRPAPGRGRGHAGSEVELRDPEGLDAGGLTAAFQEEVDTFAARTRRDEACVGEVRRVQGLEAEGRPVSGHPLARRRRVGVVADLGPAARRR